MFTYIFLFAVTNLYIIPYYFTDYLEKIVVNILIPYLNYVYKIKDIKKIINVQVLEKTANWTFTFDENGKLYITSNEIKESNNTMYSFINFITKLKYELYNKFKDTKDTNDTNDTNDTVVQNPNQEPDTNANPEPDTNANHEPDTNTNANANQEPDTNTNTNANQEPDTNPNQEPDTKDDTNANQNQEPEQSHDTNAVQTQELEQKLSIILPEDNTEFESDDSDSVIVNK